MRRWTLLSAAILVTALPGEALQKGERAPELTLLSTDGKTVSLDGLLGSVVVVAFWASWGANCGEEMKQLQALHKELGAKGLVVLAVNEREEAARAADFARRQGVTYQVLLDGGAAARLFGVNGLPDLWVIDRKGMVSARFIGYGPAVPKGVRDAVMAALAASGGPPRAETERLPPPLRAYAHLQMGAAHMNIGDAFLKAGFTDAGHFSEALREFRAGLAVDPGNVELHIWMGLALERKNERAEAVKEYQTALRLDPRNSYAQDALRRLGVPWSRPPDMGEPSY
jgi:peroxiredoxin